MSRPRYEELLAKVDNKTAEFTTRYGSKLRCQRGCSSCCQAGLAVFSVERLAIRDWLLAQPNLVKELRERARVDAKACAFLDGEGACSIYAVRPIICRTQGLPLSFKQDEMTKRDICPLNLEEIDLSSLAQDGVLNLDLLNTLLVLVDQIEGGEECGQRFSLDLKAILGE